MNMPDEPILDAAVLAELRASVGNDRSFVVDLIETYLSDSTAQIEAVEGALDQADADALVRPAHTLKSSSATLGAKRLSTLARTLEMAGRTGAIDEAAQAGGANLRRTWEATTEALRGWMAGEPA